MNDSMKTKTAAEEPVFPLHTDAQKVFLKLNSRPGENPDPERLTMKSAGEGDLGMPRPVELSWDPAEGNGILLARDPELRDVVWIPGKDGHASVNNLRIGERYWWKPESGELRSFRTEAEPPRFLQAEGTHNIRDIGGWNTEYGRHIRQGRILHGGEFNDHYKITPEGIRVLKHHLRIRTDLDLREEAVGVINHSPLGWDVKWFLIPLGCYQLLWEDTPMGREAVRRIFEILADEQNYPLYFHCWGGADRTGSIAFLLGAVLGMSMEDLMLDFEMTSLVRLSDMRDRFGDNFQSLLRVFEKEDGTSSREKAESFLRSCGVTDATIERLRKNLLEEIPEENSRTDG